MTSNSAPAARPAHVVPQAMPRTIAPPRLRSATTEPAWVKWTLIGTALAFLTFFLFVPLAIVFVVFS